MARSRCSHSFRFVVSERSMTDSQANNSVRSTRARHVRNAHLVLAALFIPLIMLIVRDRTVWAWDLAIYGQQSVELFDTFLVSPTRWIVRMVTIGDDRPVGIAWLGQAFVPLARLMAVPQIGLLLLTLSTRSEERR